MDSEIVLVVLAVNQLTNARIVQQSRPAAHKQARRRCRATAAQMFQVRSQDVGQIKKNRV